MSSYLFRARDLQNTLDRTERRACDVHELENMRQVAMFLVDFIEREPDNERIPGTLKRLEDRATNFFRKRYSHYLELRTT